MGMYSHNLWKMPIRKPASLVDGRLAMTEIDLQASAMIDANMVHGPLKAQSASDSHSHFALTGRFSLRMGLERAKATASQRRAR